MDFGQVKFFPNGIFMEVLNNLEAPQSDSRMFGKVNFALKQNISFTHYFYEGAITRVHSRSQLLSLNLSYSGNYSGNKVHLSQV